MTIGERIRYRREQLGMTQAELAAALGYRSKSSINKIELGKQELTQPKIKAVADALQTSVSYIMGWDETESTLESANLSFDDVAFEMGIPAGVLDDLKAGRVPAGFADKINKISSLLVREAAREKLGITEKEWDLIMLYRAAGKKDRTVVDTVLGII